MTKKIFFIISTFFLFPGFAGAWGPLVDSIRTVKEYGKTIDWDSAINLVAFARPEIDSFYDVYVMNPDGSNETCLTNQGNCPQKHNGCPTWHPSGEYIVFTAQNENATSDFLSTPGKGINCNLWAMNSDGSRFWQLTYLPTLYTGDAKGVLHPQFSNDGSKLLWAERIDSSYGSWWGEWDLKIADVIIDTDSVYLENTASYQPGEQHLFYETHSFSITDSEVIFSGNLVSGQPEYGLDIYKLEYGTQTLTRLTSTFEDWDEHADCSSDGKKIAWMSSTGFEIIWDSAGPYTWPNYIVTELWIMNTDGSNKERLTYFNEQGHPEYIGTRSIVSDIAWSPENDKIIATLAYETDTLNHSLKSKILMLYLNNLSVEENKINSRENVLQILPNPFCGKTVIKYSVLVNHTNVKLTICDLSGRTIKTLINETKNPGNYYTDFNSQSLPSGIYFAKLKTGNNIKIRKLILMD